MAKFYHGVSTEQADTSVSTPVTAGSGIAFVIGTAPVHTVEGGTLNDPILCLDYAAAVTAFGYSDDWEKYTICEAIYSQYKLYGVSPTIFVNVLDPAKHRSAIAAASYPVVEKQVLLPFEAIKDTVVVTDYAAGTDYELFYEDENLILEIVEGGTIAENTESLTVAFSQIDVSKVTASDIIGGFNTTTKVKSGLELVDSVFAKYRIVPDLLLAPGWSHISTVAAVLTAKAAKINGIFEGKALIDADSETVKHYADIVAYKSANNINSKSQILFWPMVKLGDYKFHMSTHAAGRMAQTDTDNGDCPAESPSNKSLQIDGVVLADGSEVLLDLSEANYLNSNGVVTALNFIGGFVLWGNETACFPSDTDVKNYFVSISRMFAWVSNSVILSYWSKIDRKMTRRLIDTIIDSLNIWLNSLVSADQLLGGRIEFLESENSLTDLMAGKAKFHIYLTPPSPAKELAFVLEYDVDYVSAALSA